jgi:hypothetical protein
MDTINNLIAITKPFAELLYFISGIGLAIFAYYGLQQITVLKNTSATQAKRDALRLTSEQCTLYFEKIIPLQNDFHKELKSRNVKFFEGWTVEVKSGSITASRKSPPNSDGLLDIANNLRFLNNMEAFAVYFTSRVADEKVAYDTLGKTFLGTIEEVMPYILQCREDGYYKNIVRLFAIWRARSESEKLLAEKNSIEKKLAAAKTSYHVPIGTD